MPVRDVTCWNAIIGGLAQGSRPDQALQLFKRMKDAGFKPNEITVLGALSACAQSGMVQEGQNVYDYIKSQHLDMNEQVCNMVIDMFGKCGHVAKAYRVFNGMRCAKTLVTFNTMIMALGINSEGVESIKLFNRISKEGLFRPDSVTYLSALCACNHSGMVDEGVKLFEKMTKDGSVVPNIKHYGTMVDLLGRAGRLNEAYNIINSIPITADAVLWHTLLGACKTYGNVEMGEKASRKLVEMGSRSDGEFVLLSNIYAAHRRWKDVGQGSSTTYADCNLSYEKLTILTSNLDRIIEDVVLKWGEQKFKIHVTEAREDRVPSFLGTSSECHRKFGAHVIQTVMELRKKKRGEFYHTIMTWRLPMLLGTSKDNACFWFF
ncbi:hypothetical protein R6Q59_020107 [Mikania micrantha]